MRRDTQKETIAPALRPSHERLRAETEGKLAIPQRLRNPVHELQRKQGATTV